MDFELKTFGLADACRQKCDALVAVVTENGRAGTDPVSKIVQAARKSGDFEPKAGKLLQAWGVEGVAAKRVVIAGAADGSPRRVQSAVQAAIGALRSKGVKRIVVCLPEDADEAAVRVATTAVAEASYVYVATKSKAEGRELERVTIAAAKGSKAAFEQGRGMALGVEFAREMGNLPPNVATPTRLGEEAKKLARQHGFKCEVLGPKEVERLGMGSFMAVARGSEEPLRFIVLQYRGASDSQAPVVLVGKGITFDSGGISIKPGPEMDEMKFDMCGAASVLGTFRALGELKPKLNVAGIIPACENLPDGRALKPGDVITSMSGQTIEVLNTDAEGRLILCDALTYAERFKPAAVVDIATLTGACVIALGGVRSGMYATDDALAQSLLAAGDAALDLCWRMPLDDEYAEGLKTNFADVANIAGRPAGSVTAAKFLQRFAGKAPWAHLDIAGTAWKGGASKGATGRPVGLLVQYLLSRQGTAATTGKTAARKGTRKAAA
ncbi:leucyl aminopeptidase [Ramlibacter algicola]|uniref:Probable cytosol aminopeptidase n=1 Tax=Ramlibacter algicola TaxID=2795217 RepID=A0A934US29_9BURK|nr:leucyl aminopeptidase [Ramlibacter algicola]MBK0393446.1 leucyl aminopeptidase [Ramlibacter algicola]